MGWSGPRRKRHRAVRMRVECACGGGTSLPGWLESACAFDRSARLRGGSSGSATRRPGWSGRRPRRGARDQARRGRPHGSTPYASIADDSEVDPDRPIKCCDAIHSISHYPPAPAMHGGDASREVPTIREILTVAMFARCAGAATRGDTRWSRCIPLPVARRRRAYVCGSGSRREGRTETVTSGWNEPTGRRKSRCHPAAPVRAHSDAATGVVEKRRKTAEGALPARRSGTWQRLRKPEEDRRSGRRSGPAACRAEARVGVPTPATRRCAARAPCRASGDQSQSRW